MQQVAENLIIQQFQQLRQELQGYNNKLMELESERRDHELVISTIEPLEATRKCYRLVGGVLVERTVGEVLPALKSNHSNLSQVIESLIESVSKKEREIAEFQAKYKIRVRSDDQQQSSHHESDSTKDGAGVLV